MEARIRRQDLAVLGLLSDGLSQDLRTNQQEAARLSLFQVSNPCWYRYETLSFEQQTPTETTSQVRVYQHFWGGDVMGGPPRSWEQEVVLVETPAGWRVDQLSEPRNEREEPNEPHERTLSACNVPRATATAATPATSATASEARSGGQATATPCPSPPPRTPDDSMYSYVSGRVVLIAPDHIVVQTADKGDVVLYPAYYKVWNDLWVKDIPIEIGDEITAADTPTGGPVLYVNIVNLIGTISNVRREGDLLLFEMEYEVRYTGKRSSNTIKVEQRASVSGSGPREGQGGQVVGRRLKDGTVLGVTVFYFDSGKSQDTGPIPTEPQATPNETSKSTPEANATQPSRDAWAEARAALPSSVPVYRPSFVPDRFGPPSLEEVKTDDQFGPRYTIVYHAENGLVAFILGMGKGALGNSPPPDTTEPIDVHGAQGWLSTTGVTTTRSRLNLQVSWQEQGRIYQIKVSSNRMTRDELLRVVASLVPSEE